MYRCPKCSFKGSFKEVRHHYHVQHAKRTESKSREKKVYTYHPPKGFKKGGGRK